MLLQKKDLQSQEMIWCVPVCVCERQRERQREEEVERWHHMCNQCAMYYFDAKMWASLSVTNVLFKVTIITYSPDYIALMYPPTSEETLQSTVPGTQPPYRAHKRSVACSLMIFQNSSTSTILCYQCKTKNRKGNDELSATLYISN